MVRRLAMLERIGCGKGCVGKDITVSSSVL